jgi:hypothetical protein
MVYAHLTPINAVVAHALIAVLPVASDIAFRQYKELSGLEAEAAIGTGAETGPSKSSVPMMEDGPGTNAQGGNTTGAPVPLTSTTSGNQVRYAKLAGTSGPEALYCSENAKESGEELVDDDDDHDEEGEEEEEEEEDRDSEADIASAMLRTVRPVSPVKESSAKNPVNADTDL